MIRAFGAAVVAAALIGCSNQTLPPTGEFCTKEARPAIQVTVTDESNAPLPSAASLRVIATDGAYADTARAVPGIANPSSFSLAYERPGTYRLDVSATGYTSTTVSDVRVVKTANDCHVVTQTVAVKLRRV